MLLAGVLKLLDSAQKNNGFALMTGASLCVFLGLSDAFLLNSIVLGPMIILIAISLFYKNKNAVNSDLKTLGQ